MGCTPMRRKQALGQFHANIQKTVPFRIDERQVERPATPQIIVNHRPIFSESLETSIRFLERDTRKNMQIKPVAIQPTHTSIENRLGSIKYQIKVLAPESSRTMSAVSIKPASTVMPTQLMVDQSKVAYSPISNIPQFQQNNQCQSRLMSPQSALQHIQMTNSVTPSNYCTPTFHGDSRKSTTSVFKMPFDSFRPDNSPVESFGLNIRHSKSGNMQNLLSKIHEQQRSDFPHTSGQINNQDFLALQIQNYNFVQN